MLFKPYSVYTVFWGLPRCFDAERIVVGAPLFFSSAKPWIFTRWRAFLSRASHVDHVGLTKNIPTRITVIIIPHFAFSEGCCSKIIQDSNHNIFSDPKDIGTCLNGCISADIEVAQITTLYLGLARVPCFTSLGSSAQHNWDMICLRISNYTALAIFRKSCAQNSSPGAEA